MENLAQTARQQRFEAAQIGAYIEGYNDAETGRVCKPLPQGKVVDILYGAYLSGFRRGVLTTKAQG